jgi:hypothetical protein
MAVPTVYIGKGVKQPPTELDDIDTPGVVPAQWKPVGDVPLPSSGSGDGGWSAVEDVPLPAQGAQADPWAPVQDIPLPQGSEEPVRGGPSVVAGGESPSSSPATQPPAAPSEATQAHTFFGREFDLAPSSGLVMRPDERTWADKLRGLLPQAGNIPQRMGERFGEGVQTMQQPGVLPKVIGAAQTMFSPISGVSDVVARDPVLNATGDLKKANDAKTLFELAAPGIGVGARNLAPAVAGRAMREAPEAAAAVQRLPPPPIGTLPPEAPPVSLPSTRVIPTAEAIEPGTAVGGAGGGGRPPIDRNASPGEFVEPPKRPLSDAEKEVLSSIGKRPGAFKKALGKAKDMVTHPQETGDAAVTQIIDNLHPFRVLDRELEKVRGVGEPTIHELARLTRGALGGAQHAIKFGTYDYRTGAQNGPGLAEITKGVNADGLRAYMLSRRDLELAARGIKTGVNSDAARRVVQETGSYYEKVFRDVVDFQDRILNYYKDAGFVSDKGYAAMKQLNQEYVPLQKVVDEVAKGTGKNLNVRQIINKIKGSDDYKNVDPLKSIVDNTYTMITLAERNRALSTFVERVERMQGSIGPLARKSPTGQRLLTGPSGEGEVASNAAFIKGRAFHPSEDTITVWKDGRPQYYRVDPKIAAAAKGLGEAELGTLTKLLGTAARGVRHGATSDPYYLLSNLLIDQITAAAQSKTGYKPFLDWLGGVKSVVGKDQAYKDWLKSGGAQSVRYSSEYNPARSDLNMISNNEGVAQRIGRLAKHPIESLTAAKEVMENATKVGEFKRIMRQVEKLRRQIEKEGDTAANIGTDIDARRRAAYQSRIVTQDFQSRGANPQLQQLNAITAFLNGNIQGNARELENITFGGRRQLLNAMRIYGAMIALPSIYTYVAGHGDDRYDRADRGEKDRNWLILPSDPNELPLKIKKPYLPGTIIGSGIERTLDAYFTKNPDAFKGFASSVLGAVTPPFLPNLAQPMLEHWANKSTFTGGKVVPDRDMRVAPPLRYGPNTSELSKRVGEKLNLTPRVIDNYIQGYGATIGRQGVEMLNGLLRPADAGEKPDTGWKDGPLARRFFSRTEGRQSISDFYENYNKYNELKQSADRLRKQGVPEEAQKYLDQIGENMGAYYKMMNDFSKQIRDIQEDRTMRGVEKAAQIKETYKTMVELAKIANGAYNIGQRQVKERDELRQGTRLP